MLCCICGTEKAEDVEIRGKIIRPLCKRCLASIQTIEVGQCECQTC